MKLLRGRVVIREDLKADTAHLTHIIVPASTEGARGRTWHRGTVLQMGEPPLTPKGVPIPVEFKAGDTVVFHFEHHEESWTRPWTDGLDATWCPHECVDGVVE